MQKIDLEKVFNVNELVSTVVKVLNEGGLVMVPSDTCYGVLVDGSNLQSVLKLRKLRNMTENDKFAFLLNDNELKGSFLESDVLSQIIEEYLPGSLTVIAEGAKKYEGRFIGFRYPDHNLLNLIKQNFKGELILTSANKVLAQPIYNLEQLESDIDYFNSFDLVLDAGTLDLNKLSTVVKVDDNQIEILREGDLIALLVSQFSHKKIENTE